ncbi:MAG: gliding motility-associated C-terminal domain-containing protein [Bacteroidota bacterium]
MHPKLLPTVGTILSLLLLASFPALAQNNDCATAEIICSDSQISFNPSGPGNNDFAPPGNNDGCLGGENQSAWYYFEIQGTAPPNLELGFTLTPDGGAGEDYDFAIFGPDAPCNGLGSPIRCSYASQSCGFCPQTGLGMGATDVSEPPSGDGFVAPLIVQPGEGYYLLIDNFLSSSTGFNLDWTGPAAPFLNCTPACDAEAGTVNANPNPACPGATISFDAQGFNMDASLFTQVMIVVDAAGQITDVIPGASGTLTSAICETYVIYSYNYETAGGSTIPTVGSNISTLNCDVECCDLESLSVSFEDSEVPTFPNAPASETLSCFDALPPLADQDWADNCDGTGTVSGTETGSADLCSGGSITREWTYTDACSNVGTYTQVITVDPAPPADFVNPPADQVVDCNSIPTGAPDLMYTNNATGGCLFEGMVSATQMGSADVCGGTITYTWEVTDPCGRTITHVQNITVNPAPPAAFLNPPADIVVDCSSIPTGAPDLLYSNNETGICLIGGFVSPTTSGSADVCGGTITYTWDFTDACGRAIQHVQNVTVNPAPEPVFLNPPADLLVACENIPTGAPDLVYSNSETGICLIEGTVAAVPSGSADICGGTITYTWTFTDPCGRTITHVQNITVDPAPEPIFLNPPADLLVDCQNIPGSAPDLTYTNNGVGLCLIQGSVSPIESNNADVCGGTITYTWQFTDPCGRTIQHVQTITVNPASLPSFTNPPADYTTTCDQVPSAPPAQNYTNSESGLCRIEGSVPGVQSGSFNECGGLITFTWEYVSPCGFSITDVQNITVEPAPPAAFDGPLPTDVTVDCNSYPAIPSLTYSNGQPGNCSISGTVAPAGSRTLSACGGVDTYTWQFTDACGRTIQHQQTVTVLPASPPAFTNLPGPITLDCSAVPVDPPFLDYNNGENGICSIQGSVRAVQSGFFDACGGTIIYDWEIPSPVGCNFPPITHQQVVTVLPASDPIFVNPPPDLTIGCGAPFPNPIDLTYSNSEAGTCGISGSVPATVTVLSPTVQQFDWIFVNPCNGATITHTQTITSSPDPDLTVAPTFVTICQGESFDLSTLLVQDLNGTNPTYTYHSGSPAGPFNQLPSPVVSPTVSTIYTILGVNPFGCSNEVNFEVFVEVPPSAGFFGTGNVCFNLSSNVNLFDFLNGSFDPTGQWQDINSYGVNLSDPFNVDLFGFPAGTYTFAYVVPSAGVCPAAMAMVEVVLLPEMEVDVLDVTCSSDPNFYEVLLQTNGFNIVPTTGTLTDLGGGQVSIADIPITTPLTFIALDPLNPDCFINVTISPPDCNCPNVDPPVSDGDQQICEGEAIPTLTVTVGAGETANWYDVPTGGMPLLSGGTSYTPVVSGPGIYVFYVEAETIADGCVSLLRTTVQLEIVENPTGLDASLEQCDEDQDGFTIFDLTEAEPLITSNTTFTFQYFASLVDAQSGSNPLPTSYTNTATPTQDLFVVVANADGCTTIVTLQLSVLVPTVPVLQITPEVCLGDNDGSFTVLSPTGAEYSLDSMIWTTDPTFDNLPPGDYTLFAEDANGCISDTSFTLDPGMELVLATLDLVCDDNGTPSDATDDFYSITILVTNSNNPGGTCTITTEEGELTTLTYGVASVVTLPANGQTLTFDIVDDQFGCSISQVVGPFNSCSTDCELTIDQLDLTCSDAGTDTDPTDDFYIIDLNVSAINGAASNLYNVLLNGTLSYTFTYGNAETFSLPADGATALITIVDTQDPQCQASQTIGPLSPCSSACSITAVANNITCDDNGTPTDPSDDTFGFELLVTGVNTATSWLTTGLVGPYGVPIGASGLPIAGGDRTYTIRDDADPSCTTVLVVPAPSTCSDQCDLSIATLDVVCNDNGTVSIQTDDFYEITVDATVVNGGLSNTFVVLVDGTPAGTFAYGTGGTITLPADGSSPVITLEDATETGCSASQAIGPLDVCNPACQLSAAVSNILCNDNGTNDPTDDTYTFELLVTGQNTSGTWEWMGTTVTGTYGTIQVLGPFPISGGDQVLTLVDGVNNNCATQVTAAAPATCSPVCNLSLVNLSRVCDDNGTIATNTDDFYEITIDVSVTNPGASTNFLVLVDGVPAGTFPYGSPAQFNLPADGSSPTITVRDENDAACSDSQTLSPLVPCNGPCTLSASVSNVLCDDNGTGNDSSDDTFTFTILVTGQNTSGTWTWPAGSISGSYGTSLVLGPFPIVAGDQVLIISDQTNPACNTTIMVSPPASCSSCTQTVDAGPDFTLTCTDQDAMLTATATPAGSYVWTGPGGFNASGLSTMVDQAGTYYFTASYPDQCVAIDSVQINVDNDLPMADAGRDTFLTCEVTELFLDGSGSGPVSNLTYEWTNAMGMVLGTDAELRVTVEGTYFLRVTDPQNGCSSLLDPVVVVDSTAPPLAVIFAEPDNILDCEVSSVLLFAQPQDHVVYTWERLTGNTTATEILITDPGAVGLIAIDTITGCESRDQIVIDDLEDYPIIDILPPPPLTCYDPTIVIDASNSQSGINIIYAWFDGLGTPIPGAMDEELRVDLGGFYILQLVDTLNGCENADTVFVESLLDAPLSNATEDVFLACAETQTTLNLELISSPADLQIEWTTTEGSILSGADGTSPEVDGTGYYYVRILDELNGCEKIDSLEVTNNPDIPELVTLQVDPERCLGENNGRLVIPEVSGGEAPYTFELLGQSTNTFGSFSNLDPGEYDLVITDRNGCRLDTNVVIGEGVDLELILPQILELNRGENGQIEATVNVEVEDLRSIRWTPADQLRCDTCLTTQILGIESQDYLLSIVHENGCPAEADLRVIIRPNFEVYIPNVFSPNEDGANDNFTLFANERVREIESLRIYDRWGEEIFLREGFAPNEPRLGWDGRFRGQLMNPAVFVYVFQIRLDDGTTRVLSGDVTLMR